ncbi:hypothetical protein [Ewingella americana]|uniref:Uncharacterized protein n=1 Tax=Ewingella americana TaxID=41202 RepID=A0A502GER5_9GAMM|nr:hypothetical protein [Ewingella americana]TPG60112.1 hypothetical protein EAH77_16215 [Ewingella americana]
MEFYLALHSLLKDLLTLAGFNLQPEHFIAFVAGVALHTAKYSYQNKVKPWDLWTHDRKWTLATLTAAGTALFALDQYYVPANPASNAPLFIYFVTGAFCNSFFNSNPDVLKQKIAERVAKKIGTSQEN